MEEKQEQESTAVQSGAVPHLSQFGHKRWRLLMAVGKELWLAGDWTARVWQQMGAGYILKGSLNGRKQKQRILNWLGVQLFGIKENFGFLEDPHQMRMQNHKTMSIKRASNTTQLLQNGLKLMLVSSSLSTQLVLSTLRILRKERLCF